MTTREMHEDILKRYYESTLKLLGNNELSESERNQILRETANVFAFSCEKISER